MPKAQMDMAAFEANAGAVADVLSLLANQRRLMVLCKLAENGEMTVTDLAQSVGLSQSALSQHLARMREHNLVSFRRESQTLWYRLADPKIETLLTTLYKLYCSAR